MDIPMLGGLCRHRRHPALLPFTHGETGEGHTLDQAGLSDSGLPAVPSNLLPPSQPPWGRLTPSGNGWRQLRLFG